MTETKKTNNPVVTIITVCYNCSDTIAATVQSVLNQDYKPIQYLIIDGASTDGTLEIINKYRENIDQVISERDSGIYDAMNKGLQYVKGDIVYFLNSGDQLFAADTITKIVSVFKENPEISLVYGDVVEYGKRISEYCSMSRDHQIQFFTRILCHQALFSRRSLFEKTRGFDLNFHIFADRDWIIRSIFLHNSRVFYTPVPVCKYLVGGFSTQHTKRFYVERIRLYLKYFFQRKIFVLLIMHPKELLFMLGLLSFSLANIISLSLINRTIAINRH
jgi:glycosyltransferase involved in cell wall biosynthesis